ncbi:MAG: hypothetical protein U0T74_15115 [Chitinophagales bacterium]
MAKIVMWGLTAPATEEQKAKLNNLKDKYESLSLQFGNTKNPSVLADCIVLLKHDNDIPENTKLKSVQWTVICSGGVTEAKINETNKTVGIPPIILIENLEDFLSATKAKNAIEKQDIEILFAIDPKMEELLNPFINALPLDENWKGTSLHSAKDKLILEVNKKLKQ